MKKLTMCVFAATLASATAITCFAADSPWNGTWKENPAKSKLTGHRLMVTEKPGGMMHFSNGGAISYDFACDGKPYPVLKGQTLTCTGNPQSGYDLTMTVNGKTLSKQHRAFSADGKEMTIKGTGYRGDGSSSNFEEVRRREGSGTGMVGTWVEAKVQDEKPDVVSLALNGDTLHMQIPAEKTTVDVKLDGSDAKVSGPTVPPGATFSAKQEGSNKLQFERKLNGKVFDDGTFVLSADGRTMTEESWVPGRMTEKETIVFEKQ